MTRFCTYSVLADFANVPYKDGGRDVEADGGLDCWGFFRKAREKVGLAVPPPHLVSGADSIRDEWEHGKASDKWVELFSPEPFCLVLFERPGRPYHCGIVLDDCISYAHMNQTGFHFAKLDSLVDRLKKKRYYRYEG